MLYEHVCRHIFKQQILCSEKVAMEHQLRSSSGNRHYVLEAFLRFLKGFNTHQLNYYRVMIDFYQYLRPNKQ